LFYKDNISAEAEAAERETARLLGLDPDAREVTINYGLIPKTDHEIAILTRSLLQIMVRLALEVDVPEEHVAEGRTVASKQSTDSESDSVARMIDIRHSAEKPDNASVAVRYQEHWFWIDDRDFVSKRTFTFLMVLFSLMETGGKEGLPLVTIPAG
jgi:hypothetical protein